MSIIDWLKKPEDGSSTDDTDTPIPTPREQTDETVSQTGQDSDPLRAEVIAALRTVFDPEIPVNIYDLGLIYDLEIATDGKVKVSMTLTSPGCPVAQTFPETVASVVRFVPGVSDAEVELVWDPPWSPEFASEATRLELGLL